MFTQIISLILKPITAAYNWLMSFFTYDTLIMSSWLVLVFIYTLIRILLGKLIPTGIIHNKPNQKAPTTTKNVNNKVRNT